MKDYRKLTKEQLLEEKKHNQEILLKSNKLYKKYNTLSTISCSACLVGLGLLAVSSNPILKLTGLCLSFAGAIPGTMIMGSSKYKHIELEHKTAVKIREEIDNALEDIEYGEEYE